jgi:hypothetical protein
MTRYIVKLTEQEDLALRQIVAQPGFDVVFKFLQIESLDAQTTAMECLDPDKEKRLLLLTDAQRTAAICSNLTRKLAAYREALIPEAEADSDPLGFSQYERTN